VSSSNHTKQSDQQPEASFNWFLLIIAIAIMVIASTVPTIFTDRHGSASHTIAMYLFWAMSAGFIRGVGFIPYSRIFRWIFSAWACYLALLLAVLFRFVV